MDNITTSYFECDEYFASYVTDESSDNNSPGMPGPGFYSFILVYTVLAFISIAPLVKWTSELGKRQQESEHRMSIDDIGNRSSREEGGENVARNYTPNDASSSSIGINNNVKSNTLRSVVLRELDNSYPDQDPDFQNHFLTFSANPQNQGEQNDLQQQANEGRNSKQQNQQIETSSVPSAATTSKIYQNLTNTSNKGFSKLVLDVNGRRWKNRRPIGRVDVISKVIVNNNDNKAPSVISSRSKAESILPDQNKIDTIRSRNSNVITKGGRNRSQQKLLFGMSDIASSILSEQYHQLHHQPQIQVDISLMKQHQLEQLQLQQQHRMQQQQHFLALQRLAVLEKQQERRRYSQQQSNRRGSRSIAASERSASVMSSIVDDISPNDAPDAKDPGKGNVFIDVDEKYWNSERRHQKGDGEEFLTKGSCCSSPFEGLLALTLNDEEKWKIIQDSIPLTLGASSQALFRLITIAFISNYLETEAMVAFLLVGLFVRLTSEELSGAIIDSLSSYVQASMHPIPHSKKESNDSILAGQYIQLAIILQLLLTLPLLFVWSIFMDPFVMWLVDSTTISQLAHEYTCIVVFAYMVQALSRTLTVVFHICGHEHFESVIDLVAETMQVFAIASVLVLVDNASLQTVALIQVLINVASAVTKITYPAARGWLKPFVGGLFLNFALVQHKVGIWHLLKAAGPLLIGTVLEYGEWELLTIFISHLGPAQVATWALLGAFWDLFEALTEGVGEAAANQVAYLISVGAVGRAKKLCKGVIYMAVTQAVIITSIYYMSGQYLAILFTTDPTIQYLMNNTIVPIGFANIIMAFSQIVWSLVGAQGRFRLATFVMFFSRWLVTMPCALVFIYAFGLNLNSVSCSLVVGYATASCILTFIVLRSDWERLTRLMQVINQPFARSTTEQEEKQGLGATEGPIIGLVDLDDFDDSSDDSDGFFG